MPSRPRLPRSKPCRAMPQPPARKPSRTKLAEKRDSGQIARVARFIAATYNGTAFPLDLFELRAVDVAISDDMLRCLDALRWARADLHTLVLVRRRARAGRDRALAPPLARRRLTSRLSPAERAAATNAADDFCPGFVAASAPHWYEHRTGASHQRVVTRRARRPALRCGRLARACAPPPTYAGVPLHEDARPDATRRAASARVPSPRCWPITWLIVGNVCWPSTWTTRATSASRCSCPAASRLRASRRTSC